MGSHVVDALTAKGHKVTVFDRNKSSFIRSGQRMIIGDITDTPVVSEAVKGQDVVYNFSGISDLDDIKTKPADTVKHNILGNLNIMDAAIRAKAKRFIYASSIYVYSQKGGFYRCSKQASELYIEEYQRRFSLDYTILRYGTLYGTRADSRNSVHRYLKQAIDTGCIICKGTGAEVREYINVRDAASLSVEAMDADYRNKHIIITGHNQIKFKDLLFMIKEILGKDIDIKFSGKSNKDHYTFTPYSFNPKIGIKLVSRHYLDMGQGILECLQEMNEGRHNDS